MIGNYIYIGISLNGLTQEVKLKGKNPIQFLQFFYLNRNDRTYRWVGHPPLKELNTIETFLKENI